jgi:hypothetical protein
VDEIVRPDEPRQPETIDGWYLTAATLTGAPLVAFLGDHAAQGHGLATLLVLVGIVSQFVAPPFALAATVSAVRAWRRDRSGAAQLTASLIALAGFAAWLALGATVR